MATSNHPARAGARPGAMTLAMDAIKPADGPKVLRIGVIQAGKIIEERIVRSRDTVSIGSTEANTFTVAGPSLPARCELFPAAAGRYRLRFTDAMDGRVATADGVSTLAQLRESGRAVRVAAGWEIAIDERWRGRVTLGDVAVLFQFVPLPPVQPRPQLPTAIRTRGFRHSDWTYNACVAAFLALGISSLGYIEYGYDPEVEDVMVIRPYDVRLATPPMAVETPQPPSTVAEASRADLPTTATAPTPHTRPAPDTTPHAPTPRSPRSSADMAAEADRLAERADMAVAHATTRPMTPFGTLMGLPSATGRPGADIFAPGHPMTGTLAALGDTGVSTATSSSGIVRPGVVATTGGPSTQHLGRGTRAVAPTGPMIATTVSVERQIIGTVTPSRPQPTGGEGSCDMNEIASVMRREIGGIRTCYNAAIRRSPGLTGRIDLSFSIGTSGRVVGTPDVDGMSQDPLFTQCIETRVRSIVFPPADGGSCEVSFPFRFDHSE